MLDRLAGVIHTGIKHASKAITGPPISLEPADSEDVFSRKRPASSTTVKRGQRRQWIGLAVSVGLSMLPSSIYHYSTRPGFYPALVNIALALATAFFFAMFVYPYPDQDFRRMRQALAALLLVGVIIALILQTCGWNIPVLPRQALGNGN
ncbi:MAG: hypothetical protein PHE83_16290 [Opitutaceae bacterium]|nr:hypothetical protein [Opitutaceae bacterium]